MPTKKQTGGGLAAVLAILVIVGLAFEDPVLSELAVMGLELTGVPITPPAGLAPDYGELADLPGWRGAVGKFGLPLLGVVAILAVLNRR